MKVTVESKGSFDREMIVAIPPERVEALYTRHVDGLMHRARVPGFRPGRAPRALVEKMYAPDLGERIADELVEETLPHALREHELRPVVAPVVEPGQLVRGQEFTYRAEIQILPAVEAKGYQELAVEQPRVEITDADVQAVLDRLLESRAGFEPADEGCLAAQGDQLVVDFVGTVDGVAFQGGTAQDFPIQIGAGRLIPGFEEQLIGAAVGDTRQVSVTFPDGYPAAELAGKPALFECRVKLISCRILPGMDDAFAQSVGHADLASLREEVRGRLAQQAEDAVESDVRGQILDGLLSANPMELPSRLLEQEVENLRETMAKNLKKQGIDAKEYQGEAMRGLYEKRAHERLALGLLIGAIARQEGIEADDADVFADLEQNAKDPEEAMRMRQFLEKNPDRMGNLRGRLVEKAVVTWIRERARISDTPLTLDQLMQRTNS